MNAAVIVAAAQVVSNSVMLLANANSVSAAAVLTASGKHSFEVTGEKTGAQKLVCSFGGRFSVVRVCLPNAPLIEDLIGGLGNGSSSAAALSF